MSASEKRPATDFSKAGNRTNSTERGCAIGVACQEGANDSFFKAKKSPLSWHRASGLRSSNFAQGWVGADDLSASRPEKTKELDQTLTAFLAQVKATTVQTKIGKDERGVRR